MTITLNSDQREAIKAHAEGPVYVVDSETERTYVLISAEDWQRVRSLLGDDQFDAADAAAAQSAAAHTTGWDDPDMEVYDEYDAHRTQS